jgi:hypothetical protein
MRYFAKIGANVSKSINSEFGKQAEIEIASCLKFIRRKQGFPLKIKSLTVASATSWKL